MANLDAPWLTVLADASARGVFGDHLSLDGEMFDADPTPDHESKVVWDRRLVALGGWFLRMGCELHIPRGHPLHGSFEREQSGHHATTRRASAAVAMRLTASSPVKAKL